MNLRGSCSSNSVYWIYLFGLSYFFFFFFFLVIILVTATFQPRRNGWKGVGYSVPGIWSRREQTQSSIRLTIKNSPSAQGGPVITSSNGSRRYCYFCKTLYQYPRRPCVAYLPTYLREKDSVFAKLWVTVLWRDFSFSLALKLFFFYFLFSSHVPFNVLRLFSDSPLSLYLPILYVPLFFSHWKIQLRDFANITRWESLVAETQIIHLIHVSFKKLPIILSSPFFFHSLSLFL